MDTGLQEKDVAVGLVMFSGRLLVRQRKDVNQLWDKKWEFPGGKVEANETPVQAVVREVAEETGLDIDRAEFRGVYDVDWYLPDRVLRVHLHCFRCEAPHDRVELEERSCYGYAWVEPAKALDMDLLEGNDEIIRRFLLSA